MEGNNFQSEMEKLLNDVRVNDGVLLNRLRNFISEIRNERDMYKAENMRLLTENERLCRENGKKNF